MIVNLETRVTCPAPGCGHKIRYTSVAAIRVNKRSLRTTDTGGRIGWLEHWRCPGCGEVLPRDLLDREPYKLSGEDAAKVAAYRLAKWGIEDGGVNVERVAGSETAATEEAGR